MKGPGFKLRSIRLQSLGAARVTEALASAGLLGDTTQRDTRDRGAGWGGTVLGSWCWGGVGALPALPYPVPVTGSLPPGCEAHLHTWLMDMPLELPASSGAFRIRWLPP